MSAPGPNLIVADLDGTLADVDHRLHFIHRPEPDWEAFYLACGQDAPIENTLTVLRALRAAGCRVAIVSGRSDLAYAQTVAWLARHEVPYDVLALRRHGDERHDEDVKADMIREHGLTPAGTLAVLEDRARVVRMWRRLGFHVFQVADGDF